jgi:hypothetical protein
MGPICRPETSVINLHYMLRNILKERRSHLSPWTHNLLPCTCRPTTSIFGYVHIIHSSPGTHHNPHSPQHDLYQHKITNTVINPRYTPHTTDTLQQAKDTRYYNPQLPQNALKDTNTNFYFPSLQHHAPHIRTGIVSGA